MKHLFTLCLFLTSVLTLNAQSVSLFNVDASNFPTVKAKLFAFDAANKQQRPSKSELTITENGQPRTITSVTCPPDTIKSLSVCIMVDTYGYGLVKLAQAGTGKLISYLLPPKDEIAITIMNQGVQIHQDFTSDMLKAANSATTIPGAPGVDIQRMFYSPISGGVPFISGRKSDKKVLVLISDLHCPKLNLDTTKLFQDAAKNNISVYSILLNTTDYSGLFKNVAAKTGGRVFEMVKTEAQIENIFQEIERLEHYIPCEVTWEGGPNCTPTADVALTWNSLRAKSQYNVFYTKLASLKVSPSFINFGGNIQSTNDTTILLSAQNTDFTISAITRKYGSADFTVINTSFPLLIPKNESRSVTLRFMPSDSSLKYVSFEFETDKCSGSMSACGGFVGTKIQTPTLKLIKPNGGETYLAGSDTLISWEGIAESDSVSLEYSIDNGNTWKYIISSTSGLQHLWKSIPKPTSNLCKVRVKQLQSTSTEGTMRIDLSGHNGLISEFSWSSDGTKIATASYDKSVILWNAVNGDRIFSLKHKNEVSSVSWSPDGNRIATAGLDSTPIIWDAVTGKELFKLIGHSDTVNKIRWSPDGSSIATASNDSLAIIWNAVTGLKTIVLRGHSAHIVDLSWCPDGKKIATSSLDSTAIIWNAISGMSIKLLHAYYAVERVGWSPDGSKLATGCANKDAIVWNATSGTKLFDLIGHTSGITTVSWSSDGSRILTSSYDKLAVIWDGNTGTRLVTMVGHQDMITAACWSPDGTKIMTASNYNDVSVRVWNTSDGTELFSIFRRSGVEWIYALSWSPIGDKVIASFGSKGVVWDPSTGAEVLTLQYGHNSFVYQALWSPDGSKVETNGDDGIAIIWDAISGKKLHKISGNGSVFNSCWSPDGSKVVIGGGNLLILFDVINGITLDTLIGHIGGTGGISWSPDGTKIASSGDDDSTRVWDATTGAMLLVLSTNTQSITDVCWSPDSKRIASASWGSVVNIWDATTGANLHTLKDPNQAFLDVKWSPDGLKLATASGMQLFGTHIPEPDSFTLRHDKQVKNVDWSPDASKLTTASDDKTAIIWDASTGYKIRTLRGHLGGLYEATWSPDGSKIATCSGDATAAIWDASTGEKLYTLIGHKYHIYTIRWSPDGNSVVTGCYDGSAKIWDVAPRPSLQEDSSDAVFSIVSPEATLKVVSIDMKKVLVGQTKDSTVLGVVCNNGTAPLHVLGIDITSGDTNDFSVPRGAGDFYLAPNDCQDVMFGFSPTQKLARTAKATIRTTTGDFTDAITIIGEGIEPKLSIVNSSIDFGKIPVGTPKDSMKVTTIRNLGPGDLTVTKIDYADVNTTNFTTLSGDTSIVLTPYRGVILDLRFLPKEVGRTSGILQFHYNGVGSPAIVQLFGEGIAVKGITPSIISTVNIPFDSVCIGHPESRTATIKNNGNVPLQLIRSEWLTNSGDVFSTSLPPQPLAVDSSITVPIDFLPTAVGISSAQVRWIADKDTAVSTVSGIGKVCANIPDTARTTVIAQDITAQAGEKVNLSLKLFKPTRMDVVGAPTDWYARIHYNKSILFNEQTNNVCPGTTDSCVLELTGVYNPKSDELISLPCIATLGNTDHSTIVIDTFYWTNSAIATDVATQNGTITITGVCEDGGVRLFIPAKNSTSLATRPNPAQDKLQIQYGLREPLTVTLELLNMTGQVVQVIVNNQSQAMGQYTLTSDLSLLGNGVYLLRLRTNKEILTTRVDVVK